MNAYKFTYTNGVVIDDFIWPLPTADGPGEWAEVGKRAKRPLTLHDLCTFRVLHAVDTDHLLDWVRPELYEIEIDETRGVIVGPNKIGFRRGRLLRRIEGWNNANLRHFAADCAEDALQYADPAWRKTLAVVIHTVRAYADGAASEADLDAAEDAAWAKTTIAKSAATDAARRAARDAVKAAATNNAWDTAWEATRDAARAAAWAAMKTLATDINGNTAEAAARGAAWAAATDAAQAKYLRWLLARIGLEAHS
jgi:hypothetical protein